MKMADFWEKAGEALKVAEWAYQNGCYNEAVSRSYFAALRAALALLEAIGFRATETKRIHFWVQSTFARECIHRRKLVPAHLAVVLSDLSELRVRADYLPEPISQTVARRALRQAQEFLGLFKGGCKQNEVKQALPTTG
jgi:uncharacterized protein (UPF0332 family)